MVKTEPSTPSGERPGRLSGVKNVIAVGSGKGGVGKSTVAVNLALALREGGATVGLLDADIYGPSTPIMLGIQGTKPEMRDARTIIPVETHGIDTISMGLLIKDTDAVVWRGPMLSKVLQQFIDDVDWGERDFLIIDLPPGTGDIHLSLAQMLDIAGALVVTTPQDIAMADVRRAVRMFRMTKVPVLGVVENMAWFTCPDTDHRHTIFGEGRTTEAAEEMDLEVLASFPIDPAISPAADRGEPILVAEPSGALAESYRALATKVADILAGRDASKSHAERFKGFFKGETS